jgi:glutaconate CoA-transferase subunit A
MTPDQVIAELSSGMTLGIGGWGSRRKPMALVQAILRSDLTDLDLVSWGGPDVGLLCAAGRVRRLTYGFVTLDSIPLEPHFRTARQGATIQAREWGEGLFLQGLRAAAWNLPFLPSRAGLGSDVLTHDAGLALVHDPYGGEDLVAVPPLKLDAALVHADVCDRHGNGAVLGPDAFFDDLFCLAAERAWVSCERVVDDLCSEAPRSCIHLNPTMVSGVVEAPGGAWFTECPPAYPRDEDTQRRYAKAARDPGATADFLAWFATAEPPR